MGVTLALNLHKLVEAEGLSLHSETGLKSLVNQRIYPSRG